MLVSALVVTRNHDYGLSTHAYDHQLHGHQYDRETSQRVMGQCIDVDSLSENADGRIPLSSDSTDKRPHTSHAAPNVSADRATIGIL